MENLTLESFTANEENAEFHFMLFDKCFDSFEQVEEDTLLIFLNKICEEDGRR